MQNKIVVFGDSISFGYGSGAVSWFDLLSTSAEKEKRAFNGAKISDVCKDIAASANAYDITYLAVGINDLLYKKAEDVNVSKLIELYIEAVRLAQKNSKKVVVLSVLPVVEDLFPNQEWLDSAMWASNKMISRFNDLLEQKLFVLDCEYINAFEEFEKTKPEGLYIDAVHLSPKGQELLKVIVENK